VFGVGGFGAMAGHVEFIGLVHTVLTLQVPAWIFFNWGKKKKKTYSHLIRGRFRINKSLSVPLPAHRSKLIYAGRKLNQHGSVN
jgi:hypothetical protein